MYEVSCMANLHLCNVRCCYGRVIAVIFYFDNDCIWDLFKVDIGDGLIYCVL